MTITAVRKGRAAAVKEGRNIKKTGGVENVPN